MDGTNQICRAILLPVSSHIRSVKVWLGDARLSFRNINFSAGPDPCPNDALHPETTNGAISASSLSCVVLFGLTSNTAGCCSACSGENGPIEIGICLDPASHFKHCSCIASPEDSSVQIAESSTSSARKSSPRSVVMQISVVI